MRLVPPFASDGAEIEADEVDVGVDLGLEERHADLRRRQRLLLGGRKLDELALRGHVDLAVAVCHSAFCA